MPDPVKPNPEPTETPKSPESPTTPQPPVPPTEPEKKPGTEEAKKEPTALKTALGTADKPQTEAEKAAEAARKELFGAPEKDYEPFKLPDGYTTDEGLTKEFAGLAKEYGLSQKGAQRMVDLYNQALQRNTQSWMESVTKWGEESKSDKEFGGTNYDANIKTATRAIQDLGTPELVELLEYSGFGNHPEFIRFAYRVGKALGEGRAHGGNSPGGETKRPPHEVLYGGNNQ